MKYQGEGDIRESDANVLKIWAKRDPKESHKLREWCKWRGPEINEKTWWHQGAGTAMGEVTLEKFPGLCPQILGAKIIYTYEYKYKYKYKY